MITEDYVSLEVAKLLEEKGFSGELEFHKHYWGYKPGKEFLTSEGFNPEYDYPAPTLQMTMKWLREIRKINIEIFTYWSIQEKAVYGNRIVSVEHANVFKEIDIVYYTYEEACESAIKYCLENLI